MRILHRPTQTSRPTGDSLLIGGEKEAFGRPLRLRRVWVPSCCQALSTRLASRAEGPAGPGRESWVLRKPPPGTLLTLPRLDVPSDRLPLSAPHPPASGPQHPPLGQRHCRAPPPGARAQLPPSREVTGALRSGRRAPAAGRPGHARLGCRANAAAASPAPDGAGLPPSPQDRC